MDRLTQRDEYGNADIKEVDSENLQLSLAFDEFNRVTEALNRLADYEDTGLAPEQVDNIRKSINLIKFNALAINQLLEEMEMKKNETN